MRWYHLSFWLMFLIHLLGYVSTVWWDAELCRTGWRRPALNKVWDRWPEPYDLSASERDRGSQGTGEEKQTSRTSRWWGRAVHEHMNIQLFVTSFFTEGQSGGSDRWSWGAWRAGSEGRQGPHQGPGRGFAESQDRNGPPSAWIPGPDEHQARSGHWDRYLQKTAGGRGEQVRETEIFTAT